MKRLRYIAPAALVLGITLSVSALAAQNGPPAGGTPHGFNEGTANWKSDTGVPPGWNLDNGNKTGWNCPNGHHHPCRPPGLQKK